MQKSILGTSGLFGKIWSLGAPLLLSQSGSIYIILREMKTAYVDENSPEINLVSNANSSCASRLIKEDLFS